MKVPKYMREPMTIVCHPRTVVAEVRRAIELDAKLQRKAGAPRIILSTFAYLAGALKRVERGESLAVALNLDDLPYNAQAKAP